MGNFYLTGMPGCGKSTIGLMLSEMAKLDFIDLDNFIVKNQRRTISDIFKDRGEAYFRKIEKECLLSVSEKNAVIVSTGGGIIKDDENIDVMKKTGKIIFIDTSCEDILKNSSLKNRPLLSGDKNKIYGLYNERYEKYKNSADYIYKNEKTALDAAKEISKYILSQK